MCQNHLVNRHFYHILKSKFRPFSGLQQMSEGVQMKDLELYFHLVPVASCDGMRGLRYKASKFAKIANLLSDLLRFGRFFCMFFCPKKCAPKMLWIREYSTQRTVLQSLKQVVTHDFWGAMFRIALKKGGIGNPSFWILNLGPLSYRLSRCIAKSRLFLK